MTRLRQRLKAGAAGWVESWSLALAFSVCGADLAASSPVGCLLALLLAPLLAPVAAAFHLAVVAPAAFAAAMRDYGGTDMTFGQIRRELEEQWWGRY